MLEYVRRGSSCFLLIIHSSFHGGDGGGEVGVGVAAAVIIFPCLYLANFFLNILQKVKT